MIIQYRKEEKRERVRPRSDINNLSRRPANSQESTVGA
jgi:hypothetical protein